MEQIKKVWRRQDLSNKLILVSGVTLAVVCVCMGKGLYGLVCIAVMAAFSVSHSAQRTKRLERLYGALYFHMPDGETVPVSFAQLRAEYLHGQGGRYAGRKVSAWFPYWRTTEEGFLDTGFGLEVDVKDYADPDGLLPRLRAGQFIYVTGVVVTPRRDYFYIGQVELIRLQEKRP